MAFGTEINRWRVRIQSHPPGGRRTQYVCVDETSLRREMTLVHVDIKQSDSILLDPIVPHDSAGADNGFYWQTHAARQ